MDQDGDAGDESLRTLEIKQGVLPRARTVITSPGHLQFWYWQPAGGSRSTAGVLGPGLDTRGDGGYVTVPPSIHPTTKTPYIVSRDEEPQPAPAWLIELIMENMGAARSTEAYVAVAAGERNTTLTSFAGTLRNKDCDEQEILAHLRVRNELPCNPPLPEAELRSIAASIGKKLAAVEQEIRPAIITDMSEAVLAGRLGELCQQMMRDFPRAYAWLAIVTVAGTLVTGHKFLPTNLFTGLVGPVGSGKTQASERCVALG